MLESTIGFQGISRSRSTIRKLKHQMSDTKALARRAASKEQWAESLSFWRQLNPEDGDREAQITGVALALRRMRRFDEADASLVEAISDLKG
jgi:hypothetical protein